MLVPVATNVVITSEWSSIVYNTQITDVTGLNKKAQLSLTNPRDACEKFARFT